MKRKNMILGGAVLIMMLLVFWIACRPVVSAAKTGRADCVRSYESIEIQPNDSLWTIAERHAASFDMSVQDYVKELRKINRLTSDRIISGGHLIVVHWE